MLGGLALPLQCVFADVQLRKLLRPPAGRPGCQLDTPGRVWPGRGGEALARAARLDLAGERCAPT